MQKVDSRKSKILILGQVKSNLSQLIVLDGTSNFTVMLSWLYLDVKVWESNSICFQLKNNFLRKRYRKDWFKSFFTGNKIIVCKFAFIYSVKGNRTNSTRTVHVFFHVSKVFFSPPDCTCLHSYIISLLLLWFFLSRRIRRREKLALVQSLSWGFMLIRAKHRMCKIQ